MTMRWLVGILILLAGWVHAAEPIVRMRVLGQQPMVAGQSVQVEVTILAPNFFLSAPAFPGLQVPGAVVTMPDERAANSTETIDGTSYAGIRKTYVFTAQTGGDFALPTPEIHFRYSGEDGKPRDASVTLPATTIRVSGQQGAPAQAASGAAEAPGEALLPAARLQVAQSFDRPTSGKDANLRAGDALVRTITIFAPGTPAMMIEPPTLAAPRGVRQFRGDPQLQDGVDAPDAPATTGGRRVEIITYVFEGSGQYTLPAVSVAWYDPATGKRAQSSAPAVTVDVHRAGPGMGLAPTGGMTLTWPDWLDWRVLVGIAVLAVIGYLLVRWRRRASPKRPHWRAIAAQRRRGRTLPPLNP
ncbi:BatD family protein [Cupriavidus pauculus]|uniref:BatD family protein n=1 Tax=Cupriavidus pauculus TaxID=82633 RepID=UPI001EE3408C|nr:BatD family protein [Cupriavidus pauculus]GJG96957.1 hypothetical protein CBA19C6_20730 [Cupriavidus pauculus]